MRSGNWFSAVAQAKNGRMGTPQRYPLLEIWNAIFYQARHGGTRTGLPHDFPPRLRSDRSTGAGETTAPWPADH